MRYILLIPFLIFIFFAGCKKSKVDSIPALKYKSTNTTELHQGETLIMKVGFTDQESDFNDTSFVVTKTVSAATENCVDPPGIGSGFSQNYGITIPTGTKEGTILITYNYNDISPKCSSLNDTAVFKFVLKDKAGHISDTAVSDQIIIYQ